MLTTIEEKVCRLTGIEPGEYLAANAKSTALNSTGGPALSAQDLKICEMTGINPHAYIEANAGNLALNSSTPTSGADPEAEAKIREAEQAVMKLMKISESEFRLIQKQSEATQLSAEEIEVCRLMGIIPADYLAEKMKSAGVTEHPTGKMSVK